MKDRIRKLMESKEMTQQEFSEFLGISPATLSSIFKGRTRPSISVVEAIRTKMPEVMTDWLVFGTGEMLACDSTKQGPPHPDCATDKPDSDGHNDVDGDNTATKPQGNETDSHNKVNIHETIKEAISSIRMQTVNDFDRKTRKITEIRVFYDDQTWETFVPKRE